MKKSVIKPTFGCGDYQYRDPYSSTLKSMQEKCTSLLRPTWNKTDVISQVDHQQLFKQLSDLDIAQYDFLDHLKFLPNIIAISIPGLKRIICSRVAITMMKKLL